MSIVLTRIPFSGSKFKVTSYFGKRSLGYHWGIDLRATEGTFIYPVSNGYVKKVVSGKVATPQSKKNENNKDFVNSGYGNYIIIEHDTGYCTLYAHLSDVNVSVDQRVLSSQIIGLAGDTGHSYGSHLHFEILDCTYQDGFVYTTKTSERRQKYSRDPLKYLTQVGESTDGNVSAANINTNYADYPTKQSIDDYENWYNDNYQIGNDTVQLLKNDDGSYVSYLGERLFGRKYRIVVYDNQGNGIDISDLHVVFRCKKTMSLDNSVSEITIYNLNSATEGQIIQYARRVTVEAGYDRLYGLIFEGDVIQAIRSKEDATDYVLRIIAMDGDRFQAQAFNSYSIIRGQTMRDVVDNTFVGSTFKVNIDDSIQSSLNDKYIRGKIVFGKAYDNAQNVIKSIPNGIGYSEDGAFYLTKISDDNNQDVIDLDYDSGLIGVPAQSDFYVTFKALLNPKIKLNRLVHIKAEYIIEQEYSDGNAQYSLFEGVDEFEANSAAYNNSNNSDLRNRIQSNVKARRGTDSYTLAKELGAQYTGIFRVVEIEFEGDTRGSQWYVNCKGVKQTGSIPTLMAGYNASNYR